MAQLVRVRTVLVPHSATAMPTPTLMIGAGAQNGSMTARPPAQLGAHLHDWSVLGPCWGWRRARGEQAEDGEPCDDGESRLIMSAPIDPIA